MSTSSSPTTNDDRFVCECEWRMRFACQREDFYEDFYKEHEGKRYCILHYPGTEKKDEFQRVLQRKLDNKDFDFRGVWFPDDVSFHEFDFTADACFAEAHFSAEADFKCAQFRADADFIFAEFIGVADFTEAQFHSNARFGALTSAPLPSSMEQSSVQMLTSAPLSSTTVLKLSTHGSARWPTSRGQSSARILTFRTQSSAQTPILAK